MREACPRCHGEGQITVNESWAKTGPDPQLDREERCPDCHGTGIAVCEECGGTGNIIAVSGLTGAYDPATGAHFGDELEPCPGCDGTGGAAPVQAEGEGR